ncbi:MAG: hypothetical protein FJ086_09605, partial [Deltaproteobacteria bacterium]|nr:hypothetical protein [Deltaproteobacteria bacterium]
EAWLAQDKVKAFLADRQKFIPAGWKRPEQVDDLVRMVHAGLHLPVELEKGERIDGLGTLPLHREVDFYMPWPDGGGQLPSGRWRVENGFLNGSMDFVFEHKDRVYFGDWKSNALGGYAPESIQRAVAASYEAQVRIYTLALCRAWGITDEGDYTKRFGGALYLFLRGFNGMGNGVGLFKPAWKSLTELEEKLKRLGDERARMPPEREEERVESTGKADKDDDDQDQDGPDAPDEEAA